MQNGNTLHALIAAFVAVAVAACPAADPQPRDSAVDTPTVIADGIAVGEGSAESVDFVVQGCQQRTAGQCRGEVPLTLTFAAVHSGAPTSFTWSLGDGAAAAKGKIVTHRYPSPGTYDVALTVVGSGGTISKLKTGFVVVSKAGPGAACAADDDCASGTCACQSTAGCLPPLNAGLCLHTCEQQCPVQPSKSICVDLSAKSGSLVQAWRTRLCLPACLSDKECTRSGFSCRSVPSAVGWVKACLPPLPRDLGAPCRTAAGKPDDALCLGGTCLSLGAAGYCSGSCQAGTCPPQGRCVQYAAAGSSPVCIVRCLAGTCTNDPLLACQPAGRAGARGFTVLGNPDPAGTTYCSARPCKTDAECGISGRCDEVAGGYCTLK